MGTDNWEWRTAPEVSELDIRFYDLVNKQVFVRWINPSVADFRQIHVVRKEGAPPTGIEDGDIVYVGNGTMYQDDNIELSKEYFYRVIVEDWDGLFSDGKTISIRTDPWEFTKIEVHAYPESVSMGDTIRLSAFGYTAQDERLNALSQRRLDGDIGGLTYHGHSFSAVLDEPGCQCSFKPTKPGTGVVTATKDGLSVSITITITE